MKKIWILFTLAAVFSMVASPALAADILYPLDVEYNDNSGIPIICKTYELSPEDDPANISTEPFERGGCRYVLSDITRNQEKTEDVREHSEQVEFPAKSSDMADALTLYASTLEVTTEDGYTGTLTLDHTTLDVSVNGYKTSSYNKTATRTYPNLSAADVSLIPKTIEDGGKTLQLEDVSWQEADTENIDDYTLPERYTATATYSGKASSKKATGYTATAVYRGQLKKVTFGPVVYRAIFEGIAIATPKPTTPEPTPVPEAEPDDVPGLSQGVLGWKVIAVILVLILFACAFALSKRKRNKR